MGRAHPLVLTSERRRWFTEATGARGKQGRAQGDSVEGAAGSGKTRRQRIEQGGGDDRGGGDGDLVVVLRSPAARGVVGKDEGDTIELLGMLAR